MKSHNLDYRVMCAKCGRLLPYYELENGFCARCRSGFGGYDANPVVVRRYSERLKRHREGLKTLYGFDVFKDISSEINRINNSLEDILCPYCKRDIIFSTTHFYLRNNSLSYIEGIYLCHNWRCRARSKSITNKEHWIAIRKRNNDILSKGNMKQSISFLEKFINKLWKLK